MNWVWFFVFSAVVFYVLWAVTYTRLVKVERENRRLHMILRDRNAGNL